jgi:hypothetical protein
LDLVLCFFEGVDDVVDDFYLFVVVFLGGLVNLFFVCEKVYGPTGIEFDSVSV